MPPIQPIAFIDVSIMTARLLVNYKDSFSTHRLRQEAVGSPHHDTESIILRGPEQPDAETWFRDTKQIDYPVLEKWNSARAVLTRIRNAVAPLNDGHPGKLGKAMIVSLKPAGFVDWHIDEGEYAEAHHRFHVCLVPAAGALFHCGDMSVQMAVGTLNFVDNRRLHSAINNGTNPRIHLVADVRRPDAP